MFSVFFLQSESFLKVLIEDRIRAFLLQKLLSIAGGYYKADGEAAEGLWSLEPAETTEGL